MAELTGLAELLAELVGRFGHAFSTDSAIIFGRNAAQEDRQARQGLNLGRGLKSKAINPRLILFICNY